MNSGRRWLLAAALTAALPAVLRADAVALKGGGELRGELLKAPDATQVVVRTLSGAQIVLPQSAVESITRRRRLLEEYETLRRQTPDTVPDQWGMAEWCKSRSLRAERERHLKRVIELEPDHLQAHQQLGHVLHEGEWTTRDEIMRARGFVKYKGKYMLPQELELALREEKESEAEKGWYKRVNMWHDWLDDRGRPDRQVEGHKNLTGISDPNAVPALYRAFHNDPLDEQRNMYVAILSQIGSGKAVGPLVLQSLQDSSDAVRMQAIKGIPDDLHGEAVPVYLRALRNDVNAIVNRAALALGIIGDESVIPALMDALVTRHRYKTWVPDQNQVSMGVTPQGQIGQQTPVSQLPPDIAVMALTGQLPQGVQVNEFPSTPARQRKVVIQKDEQNLLVRAALRKLTKEDYGYDEKAWKAWWNTTRGGKRLKP